MVKFNEIFAWLHHYEYEFNESPHLIVNKSMHEIRKILTGFEWQ